MSRIKLVVVPRWLDRVAKETGISNGDLISVEKLSCILSRRDVELYQMANSKREEIIASVAGLTGKSVGITAEFGSPIPALGIGLAEQYRDCDLDTFIYGATATRHAEGDGAAFALSVEVGDEDTLLIKVVPAGEVPAFVEGIARTLHAVLSFPDFIRTTVFKQYVRDLQINPIG